MQFALQALPFSRHAQNDGRFVHFPASAANNVPLLPSSSCANAHDTQLRAKQPAALYPAALHQRPSITSSPAAVRILRSEGSRGRLLISGRMADVCAALNRLAVNEFACR